MYGADTIAQKLRDSMKSTMQLTPRRLHQRGSPPDADGPDADPDPADAGDDRMWQPYA